MCLAEWIFKRCVSFNEYLTAVSCVLNILKVYLVADVILNFDLLMNFMHGQPDVKVIVKDIEVTIGQRS